ncbi:hypothetical protein MKW94_001410 [Papaver nudicaule]|uniref:Protein kinase domain-containing protein n=1 Tax=Papaver nudicaule TaxID=74823 RepID=A0AA41VH66_PAPNU|nr:hypothetical protein [Papaver nudicaule]
MLDCLFPLIPSTCGIGRFWETWVFAWSNNRKSIARFKDRYKLGKFLGLGKTDRFEDQYILGKILGSGNSGETYECWDRSKGEAWACKSIEKVRLFTQDQIQSVKLETQIMNSLSGHPNIVNLKEVYEDENYVHLVMELCTGGDLYDLIQKYKLKRLPEFSTRLLFRQLLLVLMYCHDNGVIHRDLKPENILLPTEGSCLPIKLADFGFATYVQPKEKLHGVYGTSYYMAPEVLTGWGYDQAADIWSAGVILYILLSGKPPFWGDTESRTLHAIMAANLEFPSDPWDQVSTSAKDLITKILCPDPAKRLSAPQILNHSWMKSCVNINNTR